MFEILAERRRQGYRTSPYSDVVPSLPPRLRGLEVLDALKCESGCQQCAEACPTGAIQPSTEYRLATRGRQDLVVDAASKDPYRLAQAIDELSRRLFGRSLKLRQVSAGGCNGCEADINVLTTVVFDRGRFGIKIVASPRHADGIIVTGPVTENMRLALEKCYACVPTPKFVIAVGACAISGGPFVKHPEQHRGCDSLLKVDLYIPGCPPHPWTILDGLLRLLGRLEPEHDARAKAAVAVSQLPTR